MDVFEKYASGIDDAFKVVYSLPVIPYRVRWQFKLSSCNKGINKYL